MRGSRRLHQTQRRSAASRRPKTSRNAVAHEEPAPDDKVRLTFRVVLPRPVAEVLVALAIRAEKNIGALVTEILEAAAAKGKG